MHIDYGKCDHDYSKANNVIMCISTDNVQNGLQPTYKFRKRWMMMIFRERLQTLFANPWFNVTSITYFVVLLKIFIFYLGVYLGSFIININQQLPQKYVYTDLLILHFWRDLSSNALTSLPDGVFHNQTDYLHTLYVEILTSILYKKMFDFWRAFGNLKGLTDTGLDTLLAALQFQCKKSSTLEFFSRQPTTGKRLRNLGTR